MEDSILHKPSPQHPINQEFKENIVKALIGILKDRVQEAYIFGSFYLESFSDQSDLDLILVKETNLAFFNRIQEFLDLVSIPMALDILIYTPVEFERIKEQAIQFPGFQRSMIESMRRIL